MTLRDAARDHQHDLVNVPCRVRCEDIEPDYSTTNTLNILGSLKRVSSSVVAKSSEAASSWSLSGR